MSENESTVSPQRQHAELLAVEVGDWAPLGGDVRLELAGRRTVLVGRNGSGKSALFEGILLSCAEMPEQLLFEFSPYERRKSIEKTRLALLPKQARFEMRDSSGKRLFYSCKPGMDESRHWRPDHPHETEISNGLLEECMVDVLGMHRVLAGVPRQTSLRGKQIVTVPKGNGYCRYLNRDEPRIGRLAEQLVSRYYQFSDGKDALAEIDELGKRIGAWETLRIDSYERAGDPEQLASVSVDGVDLGLLADGTLRVVELLWEMIRRERQGFRTLLIEEPETGVHPGLLAGLLDTIDAYTVDRQVIISTHSPQVVSWAEPQELRVVTRQEGKTQVRPLSEQQVALFLKYLHDQTLGDFVYSGALDDEG